MMDYGNIPTGIGNAGVAASGKRLDLLDASTCLRYRLVVCHPKKPRRIFAVYHIDHRGVAPDFRIFIPPCGREASRLKENNYELTH